MNKFKNDLVDYLLKIGDKSNTPLTSNLEKKQAVDFFKKLLNPIVSGKSIVMISDYDFDAYCAVIELETYLKIVESRLTNRKNGNSNIDMYFSDRTDGYTLPEEKYKKLLERYDLVVFLDTGSNYSYIKETDNVAIIDHHPTDKKNKNKNIINPNSKGNLSTSTGRIVYRLIEIFEKELKSVFGKSIKSHKGLDYIKALASISLVSDMAELDYDNRLFLKKGIEFLDENKDKFYFTSKIPEKRITAESLSFNLINIINSQSRMNINLKEVEDIFRVNVDNENIKYKVSKKTHEKIYKKMIEVHNQRKKISNELEKGLRSEIEKSKALGDNIFVTILENNKYSGINGLIAQHCLNVLNKPSVILSYDKARKKYVGSARGDGIKGAIKDIIEKNMLDMDVGGHNMACGLSASSKSTLTELSKALKNYIFKNNKKETSNETIYRNNSISEYKKSCEDYFILCDTVGVTDRFYSEISNYELVDYTQTKSGWGFATIKDENDYLSFYLKEDFIKDVKNGTPLKLQIKNSEKNTVFLDGLSDISQTLEDNIAQQKGLDK